MSDRTNTIVQHSPSIISRVARGLFSFAWMVTCRISPVFFHRWRRIVLRAFGAKIGAGAHIYPTVKIWAPWNLHMEAGSCLGPGVECYNVDMISLGRGSIVSQRAHLCTASHDFNDVAFPLISAPITIGERAWVCAEAFVGPGAAVLDGAVVAARAVVTRNVEAMTVVAGNPARKVGTRDWSSAGRKPQESEE